MFSHCVAAADFFGKMGVDEMTIATSVLKSYREHATSQRSTAL